jgi:MFS superfamily sulfate permease-like transporter
VLQLVQSMLSPYKAYAIAHADSVPAAVLVQVIQTAIDYVELDFYHRQRYSKFAWEEVQNITIGPEREDCALGIAEYPEMCYEYTECVDDEECKTRAHSTIFCAIVFGNMFVALILFLLGAGHAARVIAFVPTTVQAAFLAGVGFKIFKMGVTFMVTKTEVKQLLSFGMYGGSASPDSHRRLGDSGAGMEEGAWMGVFINFALVVALAVVINVVDLKFHHSKGGKFVWPVMMILFTVMFYILLGVYSAMDDKSYSAAFGDAQAPSRNGSHFPKLPHNMGWLMNDEQTTTDSIFPQYDAFSLDILFGAIFNTMQAANYFLLTIITLLSVLLNTVAIEEHTNQEIDFDAELRCELFVRLS